MRRIAEAFTWPFRASWQRVWFQGVICVLVIPVLFIPLLGYSVAATRSVEMDPTEAPPPFRWSLRLFSDGFWVAVILAITVAPFALTLKPLWGAVAGPTAHVIALFALVFAWGLIVLSFLPHATAAFAASGRPADLFNVAAALRGVSRDIATWNAVVAAMVTAWAIGLACAGLLCVGVVPGVFYAILVSAHAAAALHRSGPPSPTR